MRIVVNHVTRMRSPRICVAGINPETLEHVRPVTRMGEVLTRDMLRKDGGPFGPGALVELGSVVPSPRAPEMEDHRFVASRAKRLEDVSDETYLGLLKNSLAAGQRTLPARSRGRRHALVATRIRLA